MLASLTSQLAQASLQSHSLTGKSYINITAVEPQDGMRAELEKKQFKGLKVLDGVANEVKGNESRCMDAVIAARVSPRYCSNCCSGREVYASLAVSPLMQVHLTGIELVVLKRVHTQSVGPGRHMNNTFANMEALKEIYSVLNSGGIFGMIWNVEDCS